MNDPFKKLDRLARLARAETAPPVNVSARVMAGIEAGPGEEDATLTWIAALSAAAAAAVIFALIPAYQEWSNPMMSLLADLSWGLL
jgi:hypothetical protein